MESILVWVDALFLISVDVCGFKTVFAVDTFSLLVNHIDKSWPGSAKQWYVEQKSWSPSDNQKVTPSEVRKGNTNNTKAVKKHYEHLPSVGLAQKYQVIGSKLFNLTLSLTCPFILWKREEHLSAVLDIKDSLSREDRAALLKAFHDNCGETESEATLLFADIEVKPRKYGLCGCFCC